MVVEVFLCCVPKVGGGYGTFGIFPPKVAVRGRTFGKVREMDCLLMRNP